MVPLTLCTVLVGQIGCRSYTSSVELLSYKDPYFPEPYHVGFSECAYRVDASGDYHIIGLAQQEPTDDSTSRVTQYLYVHLFWKPWPGKTFAESTTTDATIRYVIVTADGTAVYSGTGFVYPKDRHGTLRAKIENAGMRIESTDGDAPELLGDSRLNGTLVANNDPNRAMDLIREMELHSSGGAAIPPHEQP